LLKASPSAVVVAMTGRPENKIPILEAGAGYFMTKNDPPERLLGILTEIGKTAKQA
jgi:hypothetical protein